MTTATLNRVVLHTTGLYMGNSIDFGKNMVRLCIIRDEPGVAANGLINGAASELGGLIHLSSAGEVRLPDFADATLFCAAEGRLKPVRVRRLIFADYLAPALRPANLRLFAGKAAAALGVCLVQRRECREACLPGRFQPQLTQ